MPHGSGVFFLEEFGTRSEQTSAIPSKSNRACLCELLDIWTYDLSSKTRGGAFWLFGFMVQGGFEVQRGFIAEGRVQACSIIEAFDVVKNHEFGLFSGFWKR
jgi:hypothetical protein